MSSPPAGSSSQPEPPGRRIDLLLGIVVGLVLGVAVVAAFVFLGSEGTIDAPRISGVDTGKPPATRPKSRAAGKSQPVRKSHHAAPIPTVRVIGGAPPPSGPVNLHFKRGERARIRINTDAPIGIEIPGYGIDETIESDSVLSFKAHRAGQFPIILAVSHIGIAELLVSR